MIHKFSIVIALCFFSFEAMSQDSKYEIDRVMEEYFSILRTEGYAPSFDDDGDITFKIEGSRYYILRRDYTSAFSIVSILNNNYACDENLYAAVNYASKNSKYAKAYLASGKNGPCSQIWIRSNLINNGKDTEEIVTTGIVGVKYCVSVLKKKYSELTE
tara:strand:+ start:155 stop:631 length:477 start_codon:yes stop_codon:yes gene_type:complete